MKALTPPPDPTYQDHTFYTTAHRAATQNDIKHVNETIGKDWPNDWQWLHERMLFSQSRRSLARGVCSERSLHVFVLVDGEGVIRRVSN